MIRYVLIAILIFSILFNKYIAQDTVKVTYYNLLNFPYLQQDRVDTLKKILDFIQPDIFVVNELTSFNGGALIKNNALNVNGVNSFASAVFYDGPDTDNLLFFDQTKFGLHSQNQIVTTLRDINEYVLYYKDPNLGLTQDTTLLYFYSLHLKAGNSSTNENRRYQDAVILKQYLVNNNKSSKLFIGGDFNFYSHTETGCQEILNGQGLNLIDPINRMGNWHVNSGYKNYHTQSTRSSSGGYAGGATGGMDDRFDFIFVSEDVMSGSDGVMYLDNSYLADGQDGSYFNQALNVFTNTNVPQSVANALFHMSDHLPVSLKFIVGGTVGINNSKTDNINISYLSFNKNLAIQGINSNCKVMLYDIKGACILNKYYRQKIDINIDLSEVNNGFYILSCILENRRINYKFVIN